MSFLSGIIIFFFALLLIFLALIIVGLKGQTYGGLEEKAKKRTEESRKGYLSFLSGIGTKLGWSWKMTILVLLAVFIILIVIGYLFPAQTLNFCTEEEVAENVEILDGDWEIQNDDYGNCALVSDGPGTILINKYQSFGKLVFHSAKKSPRDWTLMIGDHYKIAYGITEKCDLINGCRPHHNVNFSFITKSGEEIDFKYNDGNAPRYGDTPRPFEIIRRLPEEMGLDVLPGTPSVRSDGISIGNGRRTKASTPTSMEGEIRLGSATSMGIERIDLYCQIPDVSCKLDPVINWLFNR